MAIRAVFLSILSIWFSIGVESKLAIDIQSCDDLNYPDIKTASFFYIGEKNFEFEKIIRYLGDKKAEVIEVGEENIIGEAFSPNVTIWVTSHENREENCVYIKVEATKIVRSVTRETPQIALLEENIFVFVDQFNPEEIVTTLTRYLEKLCKKIFIHSVTNPKFYVLTAYTNVPQETKEVENVNKKIYDRNSNKN